MRFFRLHVRYVWIAPAALLIIGAGCTKTDDTTTTTNTVTNTNTVTANTDTTEDEEETDTSNVNTSTTAAAVEFDVTARQFEFNPATITVTKGDTVTLNITSEDVVHGFSIPDFDVNEALTPGKTTTVQFVADKAGTFSFACSIVCGSGHSTMKGQLVVEE